MTARRLAATKARREAGARCLGLTRELVIAATAAWGGTHRRTIAEPAGAAARV
jgi:hypothetical protein